jgi:hypothetical protein
MDMDLEAIPYYKQYAVNFIYIYYYSHVEPCNVHIVQAEKALLTIFLLQAVTLVATRSNPCIFKVKCDNLSLQPVHSMYTVTFPCFDC